MEVIKPRVEYQVSNYLNKDKFQTIKFVEKARSESGISSDTDGTTNEEVTKVLIKRMEELLDLGEDRYTRAALRCYEQALGFLKWRTNNKRKKKTEYLRKNADHFRATSSEDPV